MTTPKHLNRVVIKQELVELTGNWLDALILNQFLYWSHRTRDADKFIIEERQRNQEINLEPTKGWIYKSAKELSQELMTGASDTTIHRHIDALLEAGYLLRRRNPKYKWDRTWQYRPDILKIQIALQTIGYALEGYPLLVDDASNAMLNHPNTITEPTQQNVRTIPEITSEITSEKAPPPTACSSLDDSFTCADALEWNEQVAPSTDDPARIDEQTLATLKDANVWPDDGPVANGDKMSKDQFLSKNGKTHAELAVRTQEAQSREGVWSVPPGTSDLTPVSVSFAAVLTILGRTYAGLSKKEQKAWPRYLDNWAQEHDPQPDDKEIAKCVLLIPHTEKGWKTFDSPGEPGFKTALSTVLDRTRHGLPINSKGKKNGGSSTGRAEQSIAADTVVFG